MEVINFCACLGVNIPTTSTPTSPSVAPPQTTTLLQQTVKSSTKTTHFTTATTTDQPSASTAAATPEKYSTSDIIALGVGIGIGLPTLLTAVLALYKACC